jgi:type VI secretion system secreted protein VgrG
VVGKEAKKVQASLSLTVTGDVAEVFEANHSMLVTDDSYIKGTNICIEATDSITLKAGGSTITINSAGIVVETTGDIKLDAGANLDTESGADTKVKAGAMGNFEAGGVATVKGSTVKIN